jgi:serine/threonine protein kinase
MIGSGTYGVVNFVSTVDKKHITKRVRKWANICQDCHCTCDMISCTCDGACTCDKVMELEESTIKEMAALHVAQASGRTPVFWNISDELWSTDDDYVTIGMNYGGITLDDYANKLKYQDRIAFAPSLLYQLVWINLYLYNRGILHMDIKTKNILIKPQSKVVTLIDYGLLSFQTSLAKNRFITRPGTYTYMPIEVFKQNGQPVDDRVAVWSIAITIINFVMKADVLYDQYKGDTENAHKKFLSDAKHKERLVYSEEVEGHLNQVFSQSFMNLLHNMLNMKSSERPPLADILSHPLLDAGHLPKKRPPFKKLECPDYSVPEHASVPLDNVKRLEWIVGLYEFCRDNHVRHLIGLCIYILDRYASRITDPNEAYDRNLVRDVVYIAESTMYQYLHLERAALLTFNDHNPRTYDMSRVMRILNVLRGDLYAKTLDVVLAESPIYSGYNINDLLAVWIGTPPPYKGSDLFKRYHQFIEIAKPTTYPIYTTSESSRYKLNIVYVKTNDKLSLLNAPTVKLHGSVLDVEKTMSECQIRAHTLLYV